MQSNLSLRPQCCLTSDLYFTFYLMLSILINFQFAFSIPIVDKLQSLGDKRPGRPPKALVLAPTRELAQQVCDSMGSISDTLDVMAVYGGTPMHRQGGKPIQKCLSYRALPREDTTLRKTQISGCKYC